MENNIIKKTVLTKICLQQLTIILKLAVFCLLTSHCEAAGAAQKQPHLFRNESLHPGLPSLLSRSPAVPRRAA